MWCNALPRASNGPNHLGFCVRPVQAIVREVKAVFGVYGIEIDHRHLSLIADYMTQEGGYRPVPSFPLPLPLPSVSLPFTGISLTFHCLSPAFH